MKRRNFLITAGTGTLLLSAGVFNSFSTIPAPDIKMFPPGLLKTALEKYFKETLNGKNFNSDEPPHNGKFIVVKSYSIDVVENRNNIFDIADIAIKRLAKIGFDAKSLKEGIIPEGLKVEPGLLRIEGPVFPVIIDELKNYDATLKLEEFLTASTYTPPSMWKKINPDSISEVIYPNGAFSYKAKIDGQESFVIAGIKNSERKLKYRFNVEMIEPEVVLKDFPDISISSTNFAFGFLNEKILNKIILCK